jgi:hypothetical protein
MNSVVRWLIFVLTVAHGLIHFLGVAAGFGWASAPQVGDPVSVGMGVVWLASGVVAGGGCLWLRKARQLALSPMGQRTPMTR